MDESNNKPAGPPDYNRSKSAVQGLGQAEAIAAGGGELSPVAMAEDQKQAAEEQDKKEETSKPAAAQVAKEGDQSPAIKEPEKLDPPTAQRHPPEEAPAAPAAASALAPAAGKPEAEAEKAKKPVEKLSLFEQDKKNRKRRLNRITAQRKRIRQRGELQYLKESQSRLVTVNNALKIENESLNTTITMLKQRRDQGGLEALQSPQLLHAQHALMQTLLGGPGAGSGGPGPPSIQDQSRMNVFPSNIQNQQLQHAPPTVQAGDGSVNNGSHHSAAAAFHPMMMAMMRANPPAPAPAQAQQVLAAAPTSASGTAHSQGAFANLFASMMQGSGQGISSNGQNQAPLLNMPMHQQQSPQIPQQQHPGAVSRPCLQPNQLAFLASILGGQAQSATSSVQNTATSQSEQSLPWRLLAALAQHLPQAANPSNTPSPSQPDLIAALEFLGRQQQGPPNPSTVGTAPAVPSSHQQHPNVVLEPMTQMLGQAISAANQSTSSSTTVPDPNLQPVTGSFLAAPGASAAIGGATAAPDPRATAIMMALLGQANGAPPPVQQPPTGASNMMPAQQVASLLQALAQATSSSATESDSNVRN